MALAVTFDITRNPFHLLGTSVRARMAEIASAYEDALAEGRADERALLDAQKQLCTPKPRLNAELSWLPGLAPARAAEAAEAVQRGDLSAAAAGLDTLVGLDRANLAADLCARQPGATRYVETLLEAYADFNVVSLQGTIAGLRAVAGFQAPNEGLVAEALDRLREAHAEAALACIAGSDHPGAAMTAIVLAFQGEGERSVIRLLDVIVAKYDTFFAVQLGEIKDQIEKHFSRCREGDASIDVVALQHLLAEWDEVSQAVQLRMEAKSLEEPRSRDLCKLGRELCLWLANEKGRYDEALAISRALLATFPELPLTADLLQKDIESLESLAIEAATFRHMQPLVEAREAVERDFKSFNADLLNGGFGPKARGLARSLFNAFVGAVRGNSDPAGADMPWLLVRDLAIALNNEHELPEAARDLLAGLIGFAAIARPSIAVSKKLEVDRRTIDRNLMWRDLQAARGDPDQVLAKLAQLLDGADSEERSSLLSLKAGIEKAKKARTRRRVFWALAAAAFVGFIFYDANNTPQKQSRGTTPPSTTATPQVTTQPLQSTPAASASTTPIDSREEMPNIGSNNVLNRNQIRYCVFQGERIDLMRWLISTNLQTARFNEVVNDFNRRCSSFRYRDGMLDSVKREIPSKRNELKNQAEDVVASWRATSPPRTANVPASPALRLIDIQSRSGATTVQQRLQVLGFYPGTVDGLWGPQSRSALRAFKRSVRLADDANWNLDTQRALMGQ